MITTHLLEEKEKTQKKLAKEAQYDVWEYMKNTHKSVLEAQQKYGLTLKYGDIEGGTLKPLSKQPASLC